MHFSRTLWKAASAFEEKEILSIYDFLRKQRNPGKSVLRQLI